MTQFKVGDLVYCPVRGTEIYTVTKHPSNNYPLSLVNLDSCFTLGGKNVVTSSLPALFHATGANKAALETLYGREFEDVPLTGSALTQQKLTESKKPILCYCSDASDRAALASSSVRLIVNYKNDCNWFVCIAGCNWKYAVPYTGEIQND
jgi:hypothetical protein